MEETEIERKRTIFWVIQSSDLYVVKPQRRKWTNLATAFLRYRWYSLMLIPAPAIIVMLLILLNKKLVMFRRTTGEHGLSHLISALQVTWFCWRRSEGPLFTPRCRLSCRTVLRSIDVLHLFKTVILLSHWCIFDSQPVHITIGCISMHLCETVYTSVNWGCEYATHKGILV